MNWQCSIVNTALFRVAYVNYGYDWVAGSHTTEVQSLAGEQQLIFWGNLTGSFVPNQSYRVTYHTDYRGWVFPDSADTLVTITPVNST